MLHEKINNNHLYQYAVAFCCLFFFFTKYMSKTSFHFSTSLNIHVYAFFVNITSKSNVLKEEKKKQ